jgi:hypothetical protein
MQLADVMHYNLEIFSQHNIVVPCFVRHLAYARGIKAARDLLAEPQWFWAATATAHLGQATLDWCKVFGNDSEEIHWKKIFADTAQEPAMEQFRRDIVAKTGLPKPEWDAYREKMVALRNTVVAHVNPAQPFSGATPLFTVALQVAYAYQEWVTPHLRAALREQGQPEVWAEPAESFSSLYARCKAEALSLARSQ